MRAERPLLASTAFLAAGLTTLFYYGTAGSGLSAAIPWSDSHFHLNLVVDGPAAIGGVVLTVIGVLFLIWAILGALAWVGSVVAGGEHARERLANQSQSPQPEGSQFNQAPVSEHKRAS